MSALKASFTWHLFVFLALASTIRAEEVAFDFPVPAPRLTALNVFLPLDSPGIDDRKGGGAGILGINVDLDLRYDEKGKIDGEGTVDGTDVIISGTVKNKKGIWGFKIVVKNAEKADKSSKVAVKMIGDVDSGMTDIKYKGPRGKETFLDFQVNLTASLDPAQGNLTLVLDKDEKGKLVGTGDFISGLGNDPIDSGDASGKITGKSLSLKFSIGKHKFSFKGTLQEGGEYVGSLKISAPPVKVTLDFSITAVGIFEPPSSDNGGGGEDREVQIFTVYFMGGGIDGDMSINRVTTKKKTFLATYTNFGDEVYGYTNVFQSRTTGFAYPPGATTENWITIKTGRFPRVNPDFDKLPKHGEIRFSVTSLDPLGGQFFAKDEDRELTWSGEWICELDCFTEER